MEKKMESTTIGYIDTYKGSGSRKGKENGNHYYGSFWTLNPKPLNRVGTTIRIHSSIPS